MNPESLRTLLAAVAAGGTTVEEAVDRLRTLPFEDLGFARIDHHRELRTGVPEIILGATKTASDVAAIVARVVALGQLVIATRVDSEKGAEILERLDAVTRSKASYEPVPRLLVAGAPMPDRGRGVIAVVTAGTSDLQVAEEAARIAELLGNRVDRVVDVGVAGLHRVVAVRDRLEAAEVVVVVAGMEGALPTVLKGLISRPVIAVPSSIGYGTGQGGFAALLGMLNSCAPGVTVVNIDNGFGAGFAASLMNRVREVPRLAGSGAVPYANASDGSGPR